MSSILLKAYRDLTRRRLRSLLTLTGIIIGVAGVVAIVSTGRNLAGAQAAAYADASQADLTYATVNAPPGFERALLEIPNVATAELRVTFNTRWRAGGRWEDVYLVGVQDFSEVKVNRMTLREGQLPGPNELMPELSVREISQVDIGSEVTVSDWAGNQRFFTVSGFAQSPVYLSAALTNFPVVYAPASLVRKLAGASGYNQVLIKLADFGQRDETRSEIDRLFARRGLPHSAPLVRDPQHFVGKRELDSLLTVLLLFSALGLLLSGFLVANTLGAIATEQVSEIGIMKAVGGTRLQVLSAYLLLAALYGVVGTALGLAVGALGGWQLLAFIARLGNVEIGFRVSPVGVVLGAGVGIGVTLLAGLPPAWAATGIPVKAALEAYGITSTYGQGRLDRLVQRLSQGVAGYALPPAMAMAVRNLARRKARNAITLAVIAVATAALIAALSTNASVDQAINQVFTTYGADGWIWFQEPIGPQFDGALRAAPEVEAVEPWAVTDAWVKFRRVRLWGLPAETRLYRPVVVAGRWFRPGEPDAVVVSTDLAVNRQIAVGDMVEIDVGQQSRTFHVVGVIVDNSIFLGATIAGKVFAPLGQVERMLGRQDYPDFFALRFHDRTPQGVNAGLVALERRFQRFRPATESVQLDLQAAQRPARLLTLALLAMVVLVGAVGVIGVLNTLTLNVLERRREIGVMRAIGATDRSLALAFVSEGAALGLGGWVVGWLLGLAAGWFFVQALGQVLFRLDYVVTTGMVAAGFGFAVLLVALASVGPALGAARLPPAEALRYE
jgi:putative ABC transport system permease protein